MGRILFFIVLGGGLYVAFRIWRGAQQRSAAKQAPGAAAAGEAMVRCDHCGLNVPKSEALAEGDRWYCSESHRRLERDAR
jgi:uncharacterized protein